MAWIKRVLGVGIFFLLLVSVGVSTFLHFSSTGNELATKGKQYVAINVDKNDGLQKRLLQSIELYLSLFPSSNLAEFDRTHSTVGARIGHSDITDWLKPSYSIVNVINVEQLLTAVEQAQAGDVIFLSSGIYTLNQRAIPLSAAGTSQLPISVVAKQLGTVELRLNSLEGFLVTAPFWRFKNIMFKGICQQDAKCEHAFHLVGDADFFTLENNHLINFNAAIKSNGNYHSQPAQFPDNVIIRHNDIYNESIRQTSSPASPVDVVGGNNWVLADNFIADFTRQTRGKQSVVYGAFFKGGGHNVQIKNNVINCQWNLPHQSSLDIRVGLSLGNGGTAPQYCQSPVCEYEHTDGRIQDNLILNCRNDVSIYLNKAKNTRIIGNTLLHSLGIDARYPESNGRIENNTLHGRIKNRQGAVMDIQDNQVQ